ncbi:MAG: winged helix-turn-helix domain-containing protein [Bacteroidota bacterium]|nr:winged helix-turn-helix domain-containing protein [Bacteroidota bacterium]
MVDVRDRQLWRDEERVDLNARYLDALILMLREQGRLVEKERFFEEVWEDMVVSDSALSQCIKEIRRQLGDDASNPRFIQTVPRYGYRFIGEASHPDQDATTTDSRIEKSGGLPVSGIEFTKLWLAGTLGGGLAGLFGGLIYGFGLSSPEAGIGTLSTLMVLVGLNVLVGLSGAFGVSAGLSGGSILSHNQASGVWMPIVGAMLGGLMIGALAKMLGLDAFNLLFGAAPSGMTGGMEGAILGAALALGIYIGDRRFSAWSIARNWSPRLRNAVTGGFFCAVAGALIPLLGGHLMGGSLQLVAESFDGSRIEMTSFAPLFGQMSLGMVSEMIMAGMEGLFFGACVAGMYTWIRGDTFDS